MDNFKIEEVYFLKDERVVQKGTRTRPATIRGEQMEEVLYISSEGRYISIEFTKEMNKTVDRSARVLSVVDISIIKDMAVIIEVEQIDKERATSKPTLSEGIPFKLVDGESAGSDDLMNDIRSCEVLITKELGIPQEFLLNSESLENISKEPILRHIQQPVRHPLEIKTDGYCNDKDRTKNHFEKFIGGKGYVTKFKNKR